jgi:hypothetical protein
LSRAASSPRPASGDDSGKRTLRSTATVGAILGDMNNEPVYNRLYELERHFHGN